MIDILFSIFKALYNGIVTILSIITSVPAKLETIKNLVLKAFPLDYSYGLVVGSALLAIMFVSILIGIKRLIL